MMRFVKDDAVGAEREEGQRFRCRLFREGRCRRCRRCRFFHRDTTVGRNHDIYNSATRRNLGRSVAPLDTVAALRQNHTTFPSRPVKHNHRQIRFYAGVNYRPLDLSHPLRDERHWHDNQGAAIGGQVRKDEPHHHNRFAEPHFVRDDTAAHRPRHRFTTQAKLDPFALVTFRFKTGFLYIFIIQGDPDSRLLSYQNDTAAAALLNNVVVYTIIITIFLIHWDILNLLNADVVKKDFNFSTEGRRSVEGGKSLKINFSTEGEKSLKINFSTEGGKKLKYFSIRILNTRNEQATTYNDNDNHHNEPRSR